jgi:hypothetical protein
MVIPKLFKEAISTVEIVQHKMRMENEYEYIKIWKEMTVGFVKELSQKRLRETSQDDESQQQETWPN